MEALSSTSSPSPWLAAQPHRGLPAWLLSCVLHVAILVVVGLLVQVTPRGLQTERARAGGIALVRMNDGQAEYLNEDTERTDQETADSTAALSEALPSGGQAPEASGAALPLPGASPRGLAAGLSALPDAASLTRGGHSAAGLAGSGGRTSVFGIEGEGNKFVYVFDRSSSMAGYNGRPLSAAKAELISSLEQLTKSNQFQIIFYNDRPVVLNPQHPAPPRVLFATDSNKQLAQQFVDGITAAGSTRHMLALQTALGMAPDVIFFLTDAAEPQLNRSQLDQLQRLNRGATTIHAIEFGAGPFRGGENFLIRLAREHSGQHIYIDVTALASNIQARRSP